ncbi:MAG: acetaldehyde dehydrogenase (acetylating) [Xanthobacteraceae bacterium]
MTTNQTQQQHEERLRVAILGSGNIGTDLVYKVRRNPKLDLMLLAGIDPQSDGLARARDIGVATSADGVNAILEAGNIDVVFEATSAKVHKQNAPKFQAANIRAIDLTPAKAGPSVVPCVNMRDVKGEMNVNLISCAAQATIPIVHGFSRVGTVAYAEIVATIASAAAGPGSRQNIEEFTHTTARAIREIGGAETSKAMVVFNPANPEIIMRNTIYAVMDEAVDPEQVRESIAGMVADVQKYVPGYSVALEPFRRDDHFMVTIEVRGAGDYLPTYAGNLDIINAAAIAVSEEFAGQKLQ